MRTDFWSLKLNLRKKILAYMRSAHLLKDKKNSAKPVSEFQYVRSETNNPMLLGHCYIVKFLSSGIFGTGKIIGLERLSHNRGLYFYLLPNN